MKPTKHEEELWRAVRERDALGDGEFVFAVKTTGIFCRPSCRSRLPRRENVVFFANPDTARKAGFRPCLRCKPDTAHAASPSVTACVLLQGETNLSNRELASRVGLSPEHFLRRFKAEIGMTPRAYRRRILAERAKRILPKANTVIEAAFQAGYKSASRFYADVAPELGTGAAQARKRSSPERVQFALKRASIGLVLVAWTERGLCEVALGDNTSELVTALTARFPSARRNQKGLPAWVLTALNLADDPKPVNLPEDVRRTAFQHRVWSALRSIPIGETRSYTEIAHEIGAPKGARAVARACAQNQLALVIPCHRVVREDGSLAGYRWGKERKRLLLEHERKL